MKLIADYYKPNSLLSPLGGHFVMDPKEAALATNLIHPKFAIPMHYGTFPQLKGTPEECDGPGCLDRFRRGIS